ncbi:hypothetical protein Pla123a_20640 [Posidoniimonas polymericola]|uniref:Wadjet protein JetD C-terminal domain-containing protein n=1 Tax=Posidoniimonas polymericola TaxID=2528002 RepID=A0A5C5YRE8_9BACT|nr:hypothetical protein [Posidoniimonas polymericola]TWT77403.1 hypothetical protein Pla123a_20640 [Posidoniimonas polymericola]
MDCPIREYFAKTNGGDFFVAEPINAFSVLPPDHDTNVVVYFSKTTTFRWLIQRLGENRRFAAIARGFLPADHEVDWMRQFVGERRFVFLGDADPVDLLTFAWLRQRLPIEYTGLSDDLLQATGTPRNDSLLINLNEQETAALPLVQQFIDDLPGLVGQWCAGLLASGRKIEAEAMLSCATCTPLEMQAALLV